MTVTGNSNTKNRKVGLGYTIFERYVRFFHNKVYYKNFYSLNNGNIPTEGPIMIVSDHQNSLNDALALVFSINMSKRRKGRKLRAITRADAFNNPALAKIFRWVGLMPAFRMEYDGVETLGNNAETFEEATEELLDDGAVIIYPEAGHQDKHWLGKFSYGYLRLLFDAAEKSNFEKEFFILPSCNHYSAYLGFGEDVLIKFGTPISIAPYYELYKTKPRTAQRQVNALVRKQIKELMLDITDLDNYEAIDFIRNTYGVEYARRNNLNPQYLPDKLLADKKLFARLEEVKEKEPEEIQNLYNEVKSLDEEIKKLKLNKKFLNKQSGFATYYGKALLLLVLFPLFLFSFLTNVLIIYPPRIVNRKITDVMFHGTITIILSVLFTIPLTALLVFFLTWGITKSLLISVIYLISIPILSIFAIAYSKIWKSWSSEFRYRRLSIHGKLKELTAKKGHIYRTLDKLLYTYK